MLAQKKIHNIRLNSNNQYRIANFKASKYEDPLVQEWFIYLYENNYDKLLKLSNIILEKNILTYNFYVTIY